MAINIARVQDYGRHRAEFANGVNTPDFKKLPKNETLPPTPWLQAECDRWGVNLFTGNLSRGFGMAFSSAFGPIWSLNATLIGENVLPDFVHNPYLSSGNDWNVSPAFTSEIPPTYPKGREERIYNTERRWRDVSHVTFGKHCDVNPTEGRSFPFAPGFGNTSCLLPKPDWETLDTKALAGAQSKSFDFLTSLAELKKTIFQYNGMSKRLAEILKRNKVPQNVAGEWLRHRYGTRILYYELRELHEVLSGESWAKIYRDPVRAGETITFSRDIPVTDDLSRQAVGKSRLPIMGKGGLGCDKVTSSYRASVYTNSKLSRFHSTISLTAWELVPFSFVVDWFVEVGLFLRAIAGQAVAAEQDWMFTHGVQHRFERRLGNLPVPAGTATARVRTVTKPVFNVVRYWEEGPQGQTTRLRQYGLDYSADYNYAELRDRVKWHDDVTRFDWHRNVFYETVDVGSITQRIVMPVPQSVGIPPIKPSLNVYQVIDAVALIIGLAGPLGILSKKLLRRAGKLVR